MFLKNDSRFAAATVLFVGYCHRRDISGPVKKKDICYILTIWGVSC